MGELDREYKIFEGTRTVSVSLSLLASYEKAVSAFNEEVAESLLKTSGMDGSYADGVLTEALRIVMEEEIAEGEMIRELMLNGTIIKELTKDVGVKG